MISIRIVSILERLWKKRKSNEINDFKPSVNSKGLIKRLQFLSSFSRVSISLLEVAFNIKFKSYKAIKQIKSF